MSIQGSVNQLLGFSALAAGGIHKDVEASAESAIRQSIGALNKDVEWSQGILDKHPLTAAEHPELQSLVDEEKSQATQLEQEMPTVLAKHGAIGLKRLQRGAEAFTEQFTSVSKSGNINDPKWWDKQETALQRAQEEIDSRQGTKSSLEDRIQQTQQMFHNIREGVKNEQADRT